MLTQQKHHEEERLNCSLLKTEYSQPLWSEAVTNRLEFFGV